VGKKKKKRARSTCLPEEDNYKRTEGTDERGEWGRFIGRNLLAFTTAGEKVRRRYETTRKKSYIPCANKRTVFGRSRKGKENQKSAPGSTGNTADDPTEKRKKGPILLSRKRVLTNGLKKKKKFGQVPDAWTRERQREKGASA